MQVLALRLTLELRRRFWTGSDRLSGEVLIRMMFQVSTAQVNVALSDLQDLATWQQQQISSQQQLLASKVHQTSF